MLIIVKTGREDEVKRIFDGGFPPWAQIGTRHGHREHGGEVQRRSGGEHSSQKLADEAPVYQREVIRNRPT